MVGLGYKFYFSNCKVHAFNWQVTLFPKGGYHHPVHGVVRINWKDLVKSPSQSFPRLPPSHHAGFSQNVTSEKIFLNILGPKVATFRVTPQDLTLHLNFFIAFICLKFKHLIMCFIAHLSWLVTEGRAYSTLYTALA